MQFNEVYTLSNNNSLVNAVVYHSSITKDNFSLHIGKAVL